MSTTGYLVPRCGRHRPHRGLTACSCSYGRAFAPDCFRAQCLAAPAWSFATVVVTVSEHCVSYVEFMPMPSTRDATPSSRFIQQP